MDKRLKEVVRLLQLCHVFFLFAVIITVGVALVFHHKQIVIEYDSKQFVRRMTKISIGFIIGIAGAHIIPQLFFWRKMEKRRNSKRIKRFFNGSLVQMALLFALGVSLAVIFFTYQHIFIMAFFAVLFVILLAKRPNHYRLYEKTKIKI